jgi:hypothetical protein
MPKPIQVWLIALLCSFTSQVIHADNVAFYIGAHQDDWQLFMTPKAYHDIIGPDNKVVFIYTTAGDAGKGTTWWQARRAGALNSIQFAKRQKIEYVLPTLIDINNHPIPCHIIGNTRSYFMGLPDGWYGNGFPATNHQSLEKLQTSQIDSVDALVDDSQYQTRYHGWSDVVNTLKQIIEKESADETRPEGSVVNFIDPKVAEHSDHTYTGIAVEAALNNSKYRQAKFYDYAIKEKEPNVSGEDLVWKIGIYLFYNQTAFEMPNGQDHLESDYYLKWQFRQYQTHSGSVSK